MELIEELKELVLEKTIQDQSQTFLEIQYKHKNRFEIMKDQPDDPKQHWFMIDGKKFFYTQTVKEVLEELC